VFSAWTQWIVRRAAQSVIPSEVRNLSALAALDVNRTLCDKGTEEHRTMKLRWIAVLLAILFAMPAFAHGDKKHVIGTIEKISPDSVMVKTQDGKSVEVKLATTTVYLNKDGKPAKFADVAVGQRVVIHATPKGTDLVADEVRFAAPGAAATPAP
jgi:hypothetical protein